MLTTLKSRSLYTKVVKGLPLLVKSRTKVIFPHPHANLVFRRLNSTSSQAVPVYSRALEFGDKTAVIDCHGSHSYSQLYRWVLEITMTLGFGLFPVPEARGDYCHEAPSHEINRNTKMNHKIITSSFQIQPGAECPPLFPDSPW